MPYRGGEAFTLPVSALLASAQGGDRTHGRSTSRRCTGTTAAGGRSSIDHRRDAADINVDSASDGWAVGSKGATAFALRLTGSGWHAWATPQLADGGFTADDARSPTDAWAVGSVGSETLAEHWDGKRQVDRSDARAPRPGRSRDRSQSLLGPMSGRSATTPIPMPSNTAACLSSNIGPAPRGHACRPTLRLTTATVSRTTSCATSQSPEDVPGWSVTSRRTTSIAQSWSGGTAPGGATSRCRSTLARAATATTGRW